MSTRRVVAILILGLSAILLIPVGYFAVVVLPDDEWRAQHSSGELASVGTGVLSFGFAAVGCAGFAAAVAWKSRRAWLLGVTFIAIAVAGYIASLWMFFQVLNH